jgi:hypothetical protein
LSFEDQVRIALGGATLSLRQHLEADFRALADEIIRASSDDRERAVTEAVEAAAAGVRAKAEAQLLQYREAAQKHADHLKHVAESQMGELRKALEELRAQAQQQLDAARRIAQGEIEKARGEVEHARAEVKKAREETESAKGEVEFARGEAEAARGEIQHARVEAHAALLAARAESEQGLRAARAETDTARADARDEVARAQAEVARVHADVETMRTAAAAEAEEVVIARLTAENTISVRKITDAVERAHTDSHQSELSRAARLADAVRNLDEARGLSEVLERLAQCAGHEVDRAAVLLVKGERLAGWRIAGFPAGAPAAKTIDLSVDDAGLAGAVLTSGVPASRSVDATDGQPALPPFARDAGQRHAMALPVLVGGEVVAVLYADAPLIEAPSSDARWPAVLEVLTRHASRVLEAMTVQQAAGLSLSRPMPRGSHAAVPGPVEHAGTGDEDTARRYARLLLSEIRMYHEPIVDAGRRARDLTSRLRGEIDRARRLYEARVPPTVPARAEYFDQELVRTLADGDRTLLGGAQ